MTRPSLEDQIRRVAIDEVLNPSCELTKQWLQTTKLRWDGQEPVVDDVIFNSDGTSAKVYFPVLDEDYYLKVLVDVGDKPGIRWVGASAGNSVELLVCSEDRPLQELLAATDIEPVEQWEKGQPARMVRRLTSGFRYFLTRKKTGEVEDKMRSLLEALVPHRNELLCLAGIATTEVSVSYHGYKDEMWGISLDAETIALLAQLGLSLDVDIYASGPDLE